MHSRFINTGSARVGEVASLAPPPYARTQVHAPRGSGGRVMSVRACVHVAPVAHRRGERPRGRVRQVRMVAFSLFYGRPLALPRGAPERMHGMPVGGTKQASDPYVRAARSEVAWSKGRCACSEYLHIYPPSIDIRQNLGGAPLAARHDFQVTCG